MANLALYLRNRAPGIGTAGTTAGTSCTWNTLSPYSFVVVAWYTESEDNIYNAGFLNYGFNYGLTGFSYEDVSSWWNVAFANTSVKPIITWTAPDGPTPHHYSIYYQADSTTYDFRSVGYKLNSADISPGTLTYTGPVDPPDIGTSTDVYMTNVSSLYKSIRIDGNHLVSLGGGTFVTADYGGEDEAMTVEYSKLVRNARGTQTEIYMTSTADFTGIATGELLRYHAGRATFGQTLGKLPAWGLIEVVVLEPVVQLTPKLARRGHRTFDGYIAKDSQVNERLTDELDITIAGVSCTQDNWMQLMHWYEAQSTIWLIDKTTNYTDQDYPLYPQYMGKLAGMNYLGTKGKNAKDTFGFTFVVESEQSQGIGLF